jgi:uncharacterized protein YabN with tetrapyrrole methylase and pyrophosphatase domain
VNLARWKKVDAESALRGTNQRFRRRFAWIETAARSQGRGVQEMSLEELEALWQEAKRQESPGGGKRDQNTQALAPGKSG